MPDSLKMLSQGSRWVMVSSPKSRAWIPVVKGWLHALAVLIVEDVVNTPGIATDTFEWFVQPACLLETCFDFRLKLVDVPMQGIA